MPLIAAIHQPNYLPWLGFLDKARKADTFVFLDNVPFSRGSVENRNRIKTRWGAIWLTVPVHHTENTLIRDILTVDSDWEKDHWKTLRFNYSRADCFNDFFAFFEELYSKRWRYLVELNEIIIRFLFDCFNVHPTLVRGSDLKVQGRSSQLLVNICKALGASNYLSGAGSEGYLDLSLFDSQGIAVTFQEFTPFVYRQLFGEFIPNLSAVDYLFNCGGKWPI